MATFKSVNVPGIVGEAALTDKPMLHHPHVAITFTDAAGPALDEMAERFGIKRDPWIVVGTTTIDGALKDIAELFETDDMDEMIAHGGAHFIHGQHLRPMWIGVRGCNGCAILNCDIVKRQSWIGAEQAEKTEAARQRLLAIKAALPRPACPECGPHGNRGRVALAFSEVACTTCAGGVAGDAFGVVESVEIDVDISTWPTSPFPTTAQLYESYRADIAAGVRLPADLLEEQPSGFKVPTVADVRRWIGENRIIKYDDNTIQSAARLFYTPPTSGT